jgi:peptide deformylase
LWQPSAEIDPASITGPEVQADIQRIREVCFGHQEDHSKPVLVGIAAPQMGISKRIFAIDLAADGHGKVGDLRMFINPVITEESTERIEWYEGCYSTAPICGIVPRPYRVTLEAYDANGHKITYVLEGFTAREAQHELDHLEGHVFIERVKNPDNLHIVQPEEYPLYRDKEQWRNWPQKCPDGLWDKMRQEGRHATKN